MEGGRQSELRPEEQAALLEADQEIFAVLRFHRFEGPLYDKWETALVKDTCGRLSASVRSGRAFADPRTGRFEWPAHAYQNLLQMDRHEAISLANLAITLTLPRFRRDALLDGGWKPSRGATLQQYFHGSVLQTLPQAYREWKRSQKHIATEESVSLEDHDSHQDGLPRVEPPPRLVQIDDFDQAMAAVPEKYREVAVLLFRGFSISEIAKELAMSPRDVTKAKQRIKTALSRAGYSRKRR